MRTHCKITKKALFATAFTAALSACGADDPEYRLNKIDELLARNHSLTAGQTSQRTDPLSNGKRLLAEGMRNEASAQFTVAIKVLEEAADADRFNKSE